MEDRVRMLCILKAYNGPCDDEEGNKNEEEKIKNDSALTNGLQIKSSTYIVNVIE